MPSDDWLVGRDRRSEAAERIYAAAADLISRHGYEAFTIEALAAEVHCSPATIYRHAGGKAAIRDAVVVMQSARIVDATREAIKDLTGPDRVVTATIVALQRLQSDPLAQLMRSMHTTPVSEWITSSPAVTGLAAEMLGSDDSEGSESSESSSRVPTAMTRSPRSGSSVSSWRCGAGPSRTPPPNAPCCGGSSARRTASIERGLGCYRPLHLRARMTN